MSQDPNQAADVEAIVEAFQASDCTELHIRFPGFELHLSTDGRTGGAGERSSEQPSPSFQPQAPSSPAAAMASPPPAVSSDGGRLDGYTVVRAPYLGVFYRGPKPGDPPYVEVGQAVQAESDVCLVEVMKLFTAVRAGVAGRIARVLAQDGAMVEADQPLFAISPDA